MFKITKEAEEAIKILQSNGYEAYIIGGCVRDYLMGLLPSDIDVTTSAEPEEVKRAFKGYRVIETGIKHGTVTVLIDGTPIEITTYRVDSAYSDGRHPDEVCFTKSLREDAARRDFTMNAIACSINGDIVDYFEGAVDIKNKVIRCVGNPDTRFKEDALRILRALRFSSTLGFEIEVSTKRAAFKNSELLNNISAERIASELIKLLCGKNAGRVICEYVDVIGVCIPELLNMKGFNQRNPHHSMDVLEHTAAVIDSIERESVLRLSALLHDIGKPDTFTMDSDGIGHFYGHGKRSTELSEDILRRLKLDTLTRDRVVTLVKYHDVPTDEEERLVKRRLRQLSPEVFFQLLELQRADNKGQSAEYAYRQQHYDRLEEMARGIIARGECLSIKDLKINGKDLLDMGMKQGKEMGELLENLLQQVMDNKLENQEAILKKYAYEAIRKKNHVVFEGDK